MHEKVGGQTTLIDPALEKVGGQLTPLTPCFRGLCPSSSLGSPINVLTRCQREEITIKNNMSD